MRAANYVEETTTSIAGTSGDGAITLTAISNVPRFSTVFGTQATQVRYIIEDTVNKKFEMGIGVVSANVLTRTTPQITWTGAVYSDNAPSAIQFGSSPTAGDIRIRMSATAESQGIVMGGINRSILSDANWSEYSPSGHWAGDTSLSNATMVAGREYYVAYKLECAGRLQGIRFSVGTAQASSNIKMALLSVAKTGFPGQKIVDFNTVATTSTGIKTDSTTGTWTPAGPIWLPAGWYYIGFICSHAIALGGKDIGNSIKMQTPLGLRDGYGVGSTCYATGSYASGIPAAPTLASSPGIESTGGANNFPFFGLKVSP
ncbi:MAG: hypothetical protein KF871_10960 [Hydrogenophaga sp.]|uniref:hypothetical protein n=1 Tax=Hydrogenophaga sp. TaxID=1904254 RepID=UPI001D9689C2|nr:hypothetical protein [Hydrogenophaga sp.]MBX3610402.1 hypothetical protein [Hydrogenophaga sp.]